MDKESIAAQIRLHIIKINILLDIIKDERLELQVKISKNKDKRFYAKITEEL